MMRYLIKGICILLLICSLALLIMPSWLINDVSVSAAGYVINPGDYKDLTKEFRGLMDAKKLTTRFALPIFILLVANCAALIFSILLILRNGTTLLTSLVGGIGLYVYMTNVLLKAGSFAVLGPILSIMMVIVGIGAYLKNY